MLADAVRPLGDQFHLLLLDPQPETLELATRLGVRTTPTDQVTPRLFLESTSGESFVRGEVRVMRAGSSAASPVSGTFGGRNSVELKPGTIADWSTTDGVPLLAQRRVHVGKMVAVALDASELAGDSETLNSLISLAASAADTRYSMEAVPQGTQVRVSLDEEGPLFFEGEGQKYPLREVGPGIWLGAFFEEGVGRIVRDNGDTVATVARMTLEDEEYRFERVEAPKVPSLPPRRHDGSKPMIWPWVALAILAYLAWLALGGVIRSGAGHDLRVHP
jgi:hypothetical protein